MRIPLSVALLVHAAASLLHHMHNAEFLGHYPNLPAWITRPGVYAAWVVSTLIAVGGYSLLRNGQRAAGFILLLGYVGYGINSLSHYLLAPVSAHTLGMNASISLEAATAAILLIALLKTDRPPRLRV
jgi:hypothetical protein